MYLFRNLLLALIVVFSLGLSANAAPIHFVAELADDVDFENLEEKFATALAEYLNSDCGPESINIDVLDFRTFYQLSKLTGSSWYAATNYGSANLLFWLLNLGERSQSQFPVLLHFQDLLPRR